MTRLKWKMSLRNLHCHGTFSRRRMENPQMQAQFEGPDKQYPTVATTITWSREHCTQDVLRNKNTSTLRRPCSIMVEYCFSTSNIQVFRYQRLQVHELTGPEKRRVSEQDRFLKSSRPMALTKSFKDAQVAGWQASLMAVS